MEDICMMSRKVSSQMKMASFRLWKSHNAGWKWIGMQDIGDEDGNLQDCLGVLFHCSQYYSSSIFWLNLSVAPCEPPKIKRIHTWPLEPPGMSDGSPLHRPVKWLSPRQWRNLEGMLIAQDVCFLEHTICYDRLSMGYTGCVWTPAGSQLPPCQT